MSPQANNDKIKRVNDMLVDDDDEEEESKPFNKFSLV